MQRYKTLIESTYRLYEHSGFAMAGAVAFSFVVSLFPFCIFLGALSGVFGGHRLAEQAVDQMFLTLPESVAKALAPEIDRVMGRSRIDLLTVSGFIALFFATSAIETLRAALNSSYRVLETRGYPKCLLLSMFFVLVSAVSMLVLTWFIVVGPTLAAEYEPAWAKAIFDKSWFSAGWRYTLSAAIISLQLIAFHRWLAAGQRTLSDIWPGVALSVILWLMIAAFYSYYLRLSDYTRFYAGLSQLMVAMIFFQLTAIIILLGAELNRGIMEIKRRSNGHGNGSNSEPAAEGSRS